jgi:signal peptidase I
MIGIVEKRGVAARIGLCLLNLLLPGLGLVRLARYWRALFWMLVEAIATLVVIGSFVLIPQLKFEDWSGILAVALLLGVLGLLGSIVSTWRASRIVEPRSGHVWRWYGVIAVWLVAGLLSWPVSDFAKTYYRGFYISSEAMEPTLQVGDRFLADMRDIDPVRRGDLVIVRVGDEEWIKRVAAIPGDRIALHGGKVTINGTPVEQVKESSATEQTATGEAVTAHLLIEQFPGEAAAHSIRDIGPSQGDDNPETELPAGSYFLLGDNRDQSADSRFEAGPGRGLGIVPREAIVGRFLFRYWRDGEGFGPGTD